MILESGFQGTRFDKARQDLAASGRAHIPDFLLDVDAQEILSAMQALDWKIVLNRGDKTFDIDRDRLASLDLPSREELADIVHETAQDEFQFLYDAVRVSDEVEAGNDVNGTMVAFYRAMNSAPVLEGFRDLTGDPRIKYADLMASRYRPGHFLTQHSDEQPGGHRLYAFVFNLTPTWRADWGGLLMFLSADGHVEEAFTPRFGALNLLRVPQPHCVSSVAPFARGARYSLTGWLRSSRPG